MNKYELRVEECYVPMFGTNPHVHHSNIIDGLALRYGGIAEAEASCMELEWNELSRMVKGIIFPSFPPPLEAVGRFGM